MRDTGGRLAVELDGRPWRRVSVRVAAEAGLSPGTRLDRERARTLARLLRRERAEQLALRTLARQDVSRETLASRLARAGVGADVREDVVERATKAGLVDDARYAASRAHTLGRRSGDLLILDDLRRHGVDEQVAREAVDALDSESERVARIVAARGASARTLRHLTSRGFSDESLEALVAEVASGSLG